MAETGGYMGMDYQWVWTLVKVMNTDFFEPLSTPGAGAASGGAGLTPLGEQVLAVYRAIERVVARRLPELV